MDAEFDINEERSEDEMDKAIREVAEGNVLRMLVDSREVIQKGRIAWTNRRKAAERHADIVDERTATLYEYYEDAYMDLEAQMTRQIGDFAKAMPIIQEMMSVKGVGTTLAARVVSMIDISRTEHVSSLWRYAGYAVIDGKAERPKKGEKLHYNRRLKTAVYLVSLSLIRATGRGQGGISPYRKFYEASRNYYEHNPQYALPHGELNGNGEWVTVKAWTKDHIWKASLRRVAKLWLSHLWVVWRSMEGLSIEAPYVHAVLGHNTYYTPVEFGWTYPVDFTGLVAANRPLPNLED